MKISDSLASAAADYQARTGRNEHEFSAYHFPQTWSNTLAMFSRPNEIAGQAITRAYTTVILDRGSGHVYCDGRPAYRVASIEGVFLADLKAMNMAGIDSAEEQYKGCSSLS